MKVSKRKKEARKWFAAKPEPTCLNCGQPGRHFVGPSMGDVGFFVCDHLKEEMK